MSDDVNERITVIQNPRRIDPTEPRYAETVAAYGVISGEKRYVGTVVFNPQSEIDTLKQRVTALEESIRLMLLNGRAK